jgi:hypothetical protein
MICISIERLSFNTIHFHICTILSQGCILYNFASQVQFFHEAVYIQGEDFFTEFFKHADSLKAPLESYLDPIKHQEKFSPVNHFQMTLIIFNGVIS